MKKISAYSYRRRSLPFDTVNCTNYYKLLLEGASNIAFLAYYKTAVTFYADSPLFYPRRSVDEIYISTKSNIFQHLDRMLYPTQHLFPADNLHAFKQRRADLFSSHSHP